MIDVCEDCGDALCLVCNPIALHECADSRRRCERCLAAMGAEP